MNARYLQDVYAQISPKASASTGSRKDFRHRAATRY